MHWAVGEKNVQQVTTQKIAFHFLALADSEKGVIDVL
jgi:hypothetical protein